MHILSLQGDANLENVLFQCIFPSTLFDIFPRNVNVLFSHWQWNSFNLYIASGIVALYLLPSTYLCLLSCTQFKDRIGSIEQIWFQWSNCYNPDLCYLGPYVQDALSFLAFSPPQCTPQHAFCGPTLKCARILPTPRAYLMYAPLCQSIMPQAL